ncbi:hypothetical protein BIU98_17485 [Curtobacterium sp. MMLR14_010]|uniref:hypothetical protein n=1 Tax=Curtobacterium sp. MMLR14_010 TaxID=1898743 RepID=UPI0008DDD443|nr:hypothetical protein [Curtobacterium sp. MMLR14_010]OII36465.1 hypothetical protein BIU98_17485 [Curtobacterium sp. MMLR14_010]
MSPSDAQPPLSRRQARERERAASAGGQPVTPPPTVAAPQPTSVDGARRRPGSHVAPAAPGPAQSAGPVVPSAPTSSAGVPDQPPASATEIVPGSGGLTRRQIRQMRAAEGQATGPVPLRNPAPQSSDRTVQDVLGTVAELQGDQGGTTPPTAPAGFAGATPPASPTDDAADEQSTDAPAPAPLPDPAAEPSDWQEPSAETTHLDEAAVEQATSADGSPDALEPLEEAAAHAEEPRRHRSTWAPQSGDASSDEAVSGDAPSGDARSDASTDGVADPDGPTELPAGVLTDTTAAPDAAAATPGVFPLSLDDDDTNEVPVQNEDRPASAVSSAPAPQSAPGVAFVRPPEPKPMTTTFATPVGHWSTQAHDSNDTEVHDEATGIRRVAETGSNAIILPNSALADPTGALNATGEVILTGSIDLPASLSSTGSHRPIDGAEVDRLLEQHDEQPETDASPVRASRAVSSHTSTRQVVLAAAKPKESRVPMVLGITVGGVCVAAATVIIVALVSTNFFGS